METESERAPLLARCLRLNALALAFSLTHVIADYGLVGAAPQAALAGYLAIAGAVYGWWGWSLARAAGDGRSGLANLLALSGGWAVLHGATFVFTPLTNLPADVIHFGSLLFGVWAAYATWRVLRAGRAARAAYVR
ncbi:MAG TPA: hypothetical protein VFL91_01495 [Thermomicrobiales bacterium]|nr:hypothetical protein [Thermomicrobiales bacterium]